MVAALAKLVSSSDKVVHSFCLHVLPQLVKLTILSLFIICKQYRLIRSRYKFWSAIRRNSTTAYFVTHNNHRSGGGGGGEWCCSICLSDELAEGEQGMELLHCRHSFHRHCLEKWLHQYAGATCPLCKSVVVPPEVLSEYKRLLLEQEDDAIEKEFALVLLNTFDSRTCNNIFPF